MTGSYVQPISAWAIEPDSLIEVDGERNKRWLYGSVGIQYPAPDAAEYVAHGSAQSIAPQILARIDCALRLVEDRFGETKRSAVVIVE